MSKFIFFSILRYHIIEKINKNKKNLKIYGASTRGACICQYLKLSNEQFDYAVDIQLNKDGRRIPSTNIKIEMEKDTEVPDTYLILPYQFLDEFIKKNFQFLENEGHFYVLDLQTLKFL